MIISATATPNRFNVHHYQHEITGMTESRYNFGGRGWVRERIDSINPLDWIHGISQIANLSDALVSRDGSTVQHCVDPQREHGS